MKILVIHNRYQVRAGEGRSVDLVASLLRKNGDEVTTFSADNDDIEHYGWLKKIGLLFRSVFSVRTYLALKRQIGIEKPDVAHVHNVFPLLSPSVYWALKKEKVPTVQYLHNFRLVCTNGLFLDNRLEICEKCRTGNSINAVLHRCYRESFTQSLALTLSLSLHRLFKTFDKKVDLFIAPSEFLRTKLIESGLSQERIITVPHFIESDVLTPGSEFEEYAVFLGRVSKEKGVFTLLEAFLRLPDLKLILIGDGPALKEVREFISSNKMENVQLEGFISGSRRFEILRRAMVMIIPSEWYENFPYSILESFSVGTPVIASRIGGLAERIEHGRTGLLFEPGDPEDLARKITEMRRDLGRASEMRRNVRSEIEARYTEDIGYLNLQGLHNRLLKTKE